MINKKEIVIKQEEKKEIEFKKIRKVNFVNVDANEIKISIDIEEG